MNLTKYQFDQLFPFHLVIDNTLTIINIGSSLKKAIAISEDTKFTDLFTFIRPRITITNSSEFESLIDQLLIIKYNSDIKCLLKGQIKIIDEQNNFLFVGSLWVESMKEMKDLGLDFSDFAIHDTTYNLLQAVDIQENKNIEIQELYASVNKQKSQLEQLSLIVEQTQNLVIITDAKGYFEWVNKAFERKTGYQLDEIKGRSPNEILSGRETNTETTEYIKQHIIAGKTFTCDIQNYAKDGSAYWVRIEGQPVFDSQGVLTQFFSIQEDITHYKQLENQLQANLVLLKALINNLYSAILFESPYGTIVTMNSAYSNLFKKITDDSSLIGRQNKENLYKLRDYFLDEENYWEAIQLLYKQSDNKFDKDFQLKSGKWLTINCLQVWNEKQFLGLLWIFFDITERKQAEQATALSLEKQLDLNNLKTRFISMVSHEMRTPLSAILSSIQLVDNYWDKLTTEKRSVHFQRIEIAVERMTELLDDTLYISRSDANKIVFSPNIINIKDAIEKIIHEFNIEDNNSRIQIIYEGIFSGICIDVKILNHILTNLISNALKYSDAKETIILRIADENENITFTVIDKGIGIPEEDCKHLFEEFHRASNVENIQGTGLGLAIVARLVCLHHGTITFETALGKGTTFSVTLPSGRNHENSKIL